MATTTIPTPPPSGNDMTNPVVHIDRFREIFPHLSSEVIETVVRQHQCLYEPSLNALLMLSDPDFRPEAVQNNLRQQPVGEQETTPQAEYTSTPLNQLQLDEAYARSLTERNRGSTHAAPARQNHFASPPVQFFQGQSLPGQPFPGQPFPGPLPGQPTTPTPHSFNGVIWVPVQAAQGYPTPIVYVQYPGQPPYVTNGAYSYPGATMYPNPYIPGTGAAGVHPTPTPTPAPTPAPTPTSTTSSPSQISRSKSSFGGLFKNLRRGNTTATQRAPTANLNNTAPNNSPPGPSFMNQRSRRHSPSVSSLDDIPDARPLATLARTLSNDSMDDLVHNRRGRDREVFANPFGDENEVQTTVSETEHSEQQRRQPMPSPSGNRAYQHLFHDDLDRIARTIPPHPDSTQRVSPDSPTSGVRYAEQSQNFRGVQVPEVTLPTVEPQSVQSPREQSPRPRSTEPQSPEQQSPGAQATGNKASVPSPWG